MRIRILTGFFALTLASAAFASTNPGDVNFTNNNQVVKSSHAVQFKIVNQNNQTAYTEVLSATPGQNTTFLSSGAFGKTTLYDVYIVDSSQYQDSFHKCLSGIAYNPTWKALNIFGWANNGQFACAQGS